MSRAARVLVTGAARGIGLQAALQFKACGCEVVALDRAFAPSCLLPPEIERTQFDLQNIEAIPSLVASVGRVDTLVNNAGVLHCPPADGLPRGDLGFTSAQAMEIITTNVRAPVALIEALAPQMMARGQSGQVSAPPSTTEAPTHGDSCYSHSSLRYTDWWADRQRWQRLRLHRPSRPVVWRQ